MRKTEKVMGQRRGTGPFFPYRLLFIFSIGVVSVMRLIHAALNISWSGSVFAPFAVGPSKTIAEISVICCISPSTPSSYFCSTVVTTNVYLNGGSRVLVYLSLSSFVAERTERKLFSDVNNSTVFIYCFVA